MDAPVAIALVGLCVALITISAIWIRREGIKMPNEVARERAARAGRSSPPFVTAPLSVALLAVFFLLLASIQLPVLRGVAIGIAILVGISVLVDLRGIGSRQVEEWERHGFPRTRPQEAAHWFLIAGLIGLLAGVEALASS